MSTMRRAALSRLLDMAALVGLLADVLHDWSDGVWRDHWEEWFDLTEERAATRRAHHRQQRRRRA